MRLSIWQFVLLIAVLILLYVFYHLWWVDQDRETWIDRLHFWAFDKEDDGGAEQEDETEEPAREGSGWIR